MAKSVTFGLIMVFLLALGTGFVYLRTLLDIPPVAQPPEFIGPGGCLGPEECRIYCATNPSACTNFIFPSPQAPIQPAPVTTALAPPTPTSSPRAQTPAIIRPQPSVGKVSPIALPTIPVPIPIFTPTITPLTSDLLTLPTVNISELNIGAGGASNLPSFVSFFTENRTSIQFDLARFNTLLRREHNIPLLPVELIEKALADNNFAGIHESLVNYRDFLLAKINYLKSIPVKDAAVVLNQYMIGADRLTINLIDKAFEHESRLFTKFQLQDYLEKYLNTIAAYSQRFRSAGLTKSDYEPAAALHEFQKALAYFVPVARAQAGTLPFGGLITIIEECTCTGGYLFYMTPGYIPAPAPGPIFISYATIASPLLFLNKMPFPGHWILGNYLLTPGTCHSAALCVPVGGFIGIVVMAGTS